MSRHQPKDGQGTPVTTPIRPIEKPKPTKNTAESAVQLPGTSNNDQSGIAENVSSVLTSHNYSNVLPPNQRTNNPVTNQQATTSNATIPKTPQHSSVIERVGSVASMISQQSTAENSTIRGPLFERKLNIRFSDGAVRNIKIGSGFDEDKRWIIYLERNRHLLLLQKPKFNKVSKFIEMEIGWLNDAPNFDSPAAVTAQKILFQTEKFISTRYETKEKEGQLTKFIFTPTLGEAVRRVFGKGHPTPSTDQTSSQMSSVINLNLSSSSTKKKKP